MAWDGILTFCAGIVTVLTAGIIIYRTLLRRVVREACDFFAWWRKFQRDWDGEPAEPGRDAVPGVMERLNNIDGELARNGGNSLKDQVVKIREKVDAMDDRIDSIESMQHDIQSMVGAAQGRKRTGTSVA